ncbi:peroxiredoxin family protein [Pedobacter ghigonis]|uniref:peroxiredoxin family protein n=1 Tax=Pedobacter ghigonis TaxID=2730403 RepID=UPI00158BD118|nr:TlpA disulfide reductase family protein [Pedobacter ghigonis]
MRIYIFALLLISGFVQAQETPVVKWATQETFFEDLSGKDLPDFEGLTINQKTFGKADLKNQIVVINFWFEKCPPCLAEMPELNKLVGEYREKGVRFIGITHDTPMRARRFQKRNGYQYEIVSLTHDEIRKLNINHGFPSNILIGSNGKIVYATANISFTDTAFKAKSVLFEQKLKAEIEKNRGSGINIPKK